jgi:Polycystin cation channel
VVIVPCLAGFTFIIYIIFGPNDFTYHTFSNSLKSVIFFILGNLNSEDLILNNSFVAVLWSYVFFFFLIFIFLSLFMSVFITSFESTVRENGGYPEDFEDKVKWEYSDYLLWMVE